jgi:hypothetical protein
MQETLMLAFAISANVARKSVILTAVVATVLLVAAAPALAGPFPRPNQAFPGIGNDTLGPEFLIIIQPNGSAIVQNGPGFAQGPYEGAEDTYWGVINMSGNAVSSLRLTSATSNFAFDFDGDGIATDSSFQYIGGGLSGNIGPQNSSDSLSGGYGGPNGFFSNLVFNQGGFDSATINFITPIPPGFQDIFSLEGVATLSNVTVTSVAPEPGALALLGIGLGGLLVYRRRA